jgi:hypothetical protein
VARHRDRFRSAFLTGDAGDPLFVGVEIAGPVGNDERHVLDVEGFGRREPEVRVHVPRDGDQGLPGELPYFLEGVGRIEVAGVDHVIGSGGFLAHPVGDLVRS